MKTPVLVMAGKPDSNRQPRKKVNPKSLEGLNRAGRVPVPADQRRRGHAFRMPLDRWQALGQLARTVDLRLSRFIEFLGENSDLLLNPIAQLWDDAVLERWSLIPAQWEVLPIVEVLLRYRGSPGQKRSPLLKGKALSDRVSTAKGDVQSISLSPQGWEGLQRLNEKAMKPSAFVRLVANSVWLLELPLKSLTEQSFLERWKLTAKQVQSMSLLDLMMCLHQPEQES
ncbi:MAG TPA: hypothetical protein V6D18_11125 [Thermosynechococcaceae cyanobacterium]